MNHGNPCPEEAFPVVMFRDLRVYKPREEVCRWVAVGKLAFYWQASRQQRLNIIKLGDLFEFSRVPVFHLVDYWYLCTVLFVLSENEVIYIYWGMVLFIDV